MDATFGAWAALIAGLVVGAKFLLTEVVEIGVGVSLLVIVGVMTAAIVASLMRKRVSA
jgi:hypothetical protein